MPHHTSALDDCFDMGVQARENRRDLADNPFCCSTPEWREWRAGWRATLDLDEEDDPASDRLHGQDDVPLA